MANIEQKEIRLFRDDDYNALKNWLSGLGQFYDGHENGMFIEQLVGMEKKLGYFTTSKEVWVLTKNQKRIGMVCLNYKRGGAVKVSPLVISSLERRRGFGTQLLLFAEERAKKKGRRKRRR